MSVDLTLSIVSHGQGALLARLLADLCALRWTARPTVIVTLNLPGETFDASGFAALDLLVLRNTRPKGFGANHNAAFAHCRNAWFAVLNPDLRLPQDPFRDLLAQGGARPDLAAIAPAVVNAAGEPEDHVRPNLTPGALWRRMRGAAEPVDSTVVSRSPDPFYWLAGMFILFRSDAFRKVGGFDTRFFLYCEDYDICARLYARGYGLTVVPSSRAIHEAQRDSHRSLKHLAWHLRSIATVWLSISFWRIVMQRRPTR